MLDFHFRAGVIGLDAFLDGPRHAACHAVAPASAGGIRHLVHGPNLLQEDSFRLEHPRQLLEGDDEVHVRAHRPAAGLQLLGSAGAYEHHQGFRMLLFDDPGRGHHGGQLIADLVDGLREKMLRHHRPGRTAGRQGEFLISRGHLFHIMLRLRHTAQIRADGSLVDIREAKLLQGRLEHLRRDLRPELSGKGGRYLGDDLPARLHGADQLEYLGLVRYRPEGTADHAHPAGHAHFIVNIGAAEPVGLDGVYAAGGLAGALLVADGVIGTHILAFPALDAFLLVNHGLAVHHGDSPLWAYAVARMGYAAHAGAGDFIMVLRAGIAGRGDDLHQRRLIVFLIDIALFQSLCQMAGMLSVLRPQAHAHGQADALSDNGPVAVYALPVQGLFIIYDFVGERLHVIL